VTLAALGCVVLSACAGSVRAGTVVVSGARTGPGVKKVVAKRPPERLLADDGSGCDVSPDRFRDTPVGALFDCPDWRDEPPR
jgi:hypothetical protein